MFHKQIQIVFDSNKSDSDTDMIEIETISQHCFERATGSEGIVRTGAGAYFPLKLFTCFSGWNSWTSL